MNNPRYCLLRNRYIAPTNNAGAPSPSTENSGTVAVVVFVVGVAVTTSIVGVAVGVAVGVVVGVAVGFTVGVAVGFTVGVAVGFTVGVAVGFTVGVGVHFSIADPTCASVTAPVNTMFCDPETMTVGVVVIRFASAIPLPGF
jgi:hypothetical protein